MEEWPKAMTILRKNPEGITLIKIVESIYPQITGREKMRAYDRLWARCEKATRDGKVERLEMVYGLGYRMIR